MKRRAALAVVAVAAALSFAGQAVAWPLDDLTRRDSSDYLMTFLELGRVDPLFTTQMMARPPVAPLVLGGSLELGGPLLLESVMGIAFVATITAYFAAVRRFGSLLGVVVGALLVVSLDVGALYHQVSSDALFATGLGFLALALAHAWTSPTSRAFGFVGLVATLCVLTRPSGLVVLPVLAACIAVVPGGWRPRIMRLAAYMAVGGLVLGLYASVNAVRYGQVAIASTGLPSPLYRLFVEDHLVSPRQTTRRQDCSSPSSTSRVGLS